MLPRCYSLQKFPLQRAALVKEVQNRQRLLFPKLGDSCLYGHVGRRHYFVDNIERDLIFSDQGKKQFAKPKPIMDVSDIQGTKPSLAPESRKNVEKFLRKESARTFADSLEKLHHEFSSKHLVKTKHDLGLSPIKFQSVSLPKLQNKVNSPTHSVLSNSQLVRVSPTFISYLNFQ